MELVAVASSESKNELVDSAWKIGFQNLQIEFGVVVASIDNVRKLAIPFFEDFISVLRVYTHKLVRNELVNLESNPKVKFNVVKRLLMSNVLGKEVKACLGLS